MASDFSNSGAFNVNGQWVITVRYEAAIDHGAISQVQLRFLNGRNEVACALVSTDEARELLGEKNYAAIVETGAVAQAGRSDTGSFSIKGELRGKSLEFRQVTLAGYEATQTENTIALDSRAPRKEAPPSREAHERPSTAPMPDDRASASTAETKHDVPTAADAAVQPPRDGTDVSREHDDQQWLHLARTAAVPDSVAERFLRVDNKYYFPDKTLAFTDRGTKLRAETHNLEVIRCLMTIAQARGWQAISITGTPEFRREVWREASLRGLDVRGYEPSGIEREEVRRAMEKRHGTNETSHEALHHASGHAADERAKAPAPISRATEPSGGRRTRPTTTEIGRVTLLTGQLLAAGPATYKFDPKGGLSYYVKLQTDDGERIVWGIDLERALVESQSGVRIGDVVTIENQGSKPVTVKMPRLDQAGNVIGEKEIATHRNTWLIEKPSHFEQRARKVAAFRSGEATREELVRRYPDLTSAVVSLWLGEQFATKTIERPDNRERVVALVKERLAQALERGDLINVPKLKQEVARKLDAVATDVADIVQRSRSRRVTRPPRDRSPEVTPHARA